MFSAANPRFRHFGPRMEHGGRFDDVIGKAPEMTGYPQTVERAPTIRALVSDVDGTLVTSEKLLSRRTLACVAEMDRRGVLFSIVSSRPPRGLRSLIEQMPVTAPIAAFNGGVLLTSKLELLEESLLAPTTARAVVEELISRGVDIWLFSGDEWFVRDDANPYVAREARALNFRPTSVPTFSARLATAAKIVGISAHWDLVEQCERDLGKMFAGAATVARSQTYALDITHPQANKGVALTKIAHLIKIPLSEIAVIGDGGNDVSMFKRAALSVAMGNASLAVRRAAAFVTAGNDEDGFAEAVDRFILRAPELYSSELTKAHNSCPR